MFWLSVGALLFCLTGRAWADESQGASLNLTGIAPAMCSFGAAETVGGTNMALSQNSGGGSVIQVGQLLDPATAKILPAAIQLSFNARCNYPHTVTFRSLQGGLMPLAQTADNPAFAHRVDYTATVTWGAVSSAITTSGVSGLQGSSKLIGGAFSGRLTLDLTVLATETKPVAAGIYSDILVLTLGTRL